MSTQLHIPTAEAAFIANLTDRQMNRIVDEHLVPEPLVVQQGAVDCSLDWALHLPRSTLRPRISSLPTLVGKCSKN